QEALNQRMGALGSSGNASTDFEETVYYTFTSSENLAALLSLEGERLAGPLAGVGEDVFNVEREVVRSELRERNETGYSGRALAMIQESLFTVSHPYNRPVGGTHTSISAATLEEARAFAAARY